MTGALWIRQFATEVEVCLVEIIPSMSDDDHVELPTYFNSGVGFLFPIALIAGNLKSIEEALHRNIEFAKAVATGKIMHDEGDARRLVDTTTHILSKAA